jgi:hypothetical protein
MGVETLLQDEIESEEVPLVGALQVYWFPQVGGHMFTYPADTIENAVAMLDMFYKYDMFQFSNSIKGDYTNEGGVHVWADDNGSGQPGWVEWNMYEEIHEYEDTEFIQEEGAALLIH